MKEAWEHVAFYDGTLAIDMARSAGALRCEGGSIGRKPVDGKCEVCGAVAPLNPKGNVARHDRGQ